MKTKGKKLKNLGDDMQWSKMDMIEVLKEENENGTKKISSNPQIQAYHGTESKKNKDTIY